MSLSGQHWMEALYFWEDGNSGWTRTFSVHNFWRAQSQIINFIVKYYFKNVYGIMIILNNWTFVSSFSLKYSKIWNTVVMQIHSYWVCIKHLKKYFQLASVCMEMYYTPMGFILDVHFNGSQNWDQSQSGSAITQLKEFLLKI